MSDGHEGEPENPVAAPVEVAADARDPLEGLVERTAADPAVVFLPDVLERLRAMKERERARFEALRPRLKSAGARVAALDEALAKDGANAGGCGHGAG